MTSESPIESTSARFCNDSVLIFAVADVTNAARALARALARHVQSRASTHSRAGAHTRTRGVGAHQRRTGAATNAADLRARESMISPSRALMTAHTGKRKHGKPFDGTPFHNMTLVHHGSPATSQPARAPSNGRRVAVPAMSVARTHECCARSTTERLFRERQRRRSVRRRARARQPTRPASSADTFITAALAGATSSSHATSIV